MSLFPRITCRKCGREFSGIRSRCPYCGTLRVKQSERTPNPTPGENPEVPAGERAAVNTRWQLIFGAILLAAVVLAVIVLVSVSLNGEVQATPSPTLPLVTFTPATPSPTPTPTPTPELQSIGIYYYDRALEDFTEPVGVSLYLSVQVFPTTVPIDGAVKWTSSDPNVVSVTQDGNNCTVTMVSSGVCTITAECYNVSCSVTARVR